MVKVCIRCRETKPGTEFAVSKITRDGLATYCKACHSEATRKLYAASPQYDPAGYPERDWVRGPGEPIVLATITLKDGSLATVDREDALWLTRWTWYAHKDGGVVGRVGTRRMVFIHRLIMNAQAGEIIDHIDGDRRNNARGNLRFATQAQNRRNNRNVRGGTSRFKGVYWETDRGIWVAMIQHNYRRINLGSFSDELAAARAYDQAAQDLHGAFASLNFPEVTQ